MTHPTATATATATAVVERRERSPAAAGRAAGLCLVVHDDMELRLRLAALVRKALPALDADSVDRTAFAAMNADRIGAYVAVLLIVEFSLQAVGVDPLANLVRLRNLAPLLPILVFARGGDERNAARSVKLGASDYWPIHSVKVDELTLALSSLIEYPRVGEAAKSKPVDRWRQPEIAGYRLMKKIAQSASASVYLARNDDLAQPVALKVQAIEGLKTATETGRQRFARECEILSALNHRSIADVLDFGITADYLFLALEYFPCGSLRERLKNPLREADACNYARQIGEALQVLHTAQIVHCDLKPSNVMLTDDNRVVLIDFGSARSQLVSRDLSRSDLGTGTPYYVCPEQIAGRDPDARGDLYSLGIVLFEMLTGTLPFAGKTLTDIFAAHRIADVPRLPQHLCRYQPIVDRLLAKSPDDRYGSVESFLEALSAARGAGASRPPTSPAFFKGATES
jgi:tRNA A-37 threonylcarbamoyl transferase component Bud32